MKTSQSTKREESRRPRGVRLWLFRVMAILGAPVVFLALLEGGLEIAGVGKPGAFLVESAEPGFVETNQFFGRRFFPASIARTPEVERFRQSKEEGAYRIFVLGGSAAMGFPEPGFGVGRVLEALLREEYEGLNVEVINAAMTAVNSHVVLPIARDCARYEPDAFVVYMGNNEVVGPYGPSSVFGDSSLSLPMVRAAVRLRAARTGELLARVAASASSTAPPSEWKGMSMFLENQVRWGDPRLETVYENFGANLRDIGRTGVEAGAQVLVSTVAVNLADSAPFASPNPELDAAEGEAWADAYREGADCQQSEKCVEAIERFESAAELDDQHADLAFRLGQCLRALGRTEEARSQFERARDLDALRFRADSRVNEVIRKTAESESGLTLVDAEGVFAQASGDGLTGAEWFYEHVHLNFGGNYLLARSIAESLRPDMESKGGRRTGRVATEESVAKRLVLTRWDRYRMWRDIAALMEQPPFPNQLDHEEVRSKATARLSGLLEGRAPSAWRREAVDFYASAIDQAPGDLHVRRRYAELLDAAGRPREAAAAWRTLLESSPANLYWLKSLGASLREAGDLDGALQAFRKVLDADEQDAAAHFGLGSVLQKQGKLVEAVEAYEEALRLRPAYAEAVNNLGLVAMERGRDSEAVAQFQRAIETRPGFGEAHENLGIAFLKLGQAESAREQFQRAGEISLDASSPRYHLGASLAAEGKFNQALPLLMEAVRLDPDSAEAHYALASVLASTGEVDAALDHLSQATQLNPRLAEAHYNKGLLLARQGQLEEAVASYRQAVAVRPEYPEAWNNMGTAFARRGMMQDAERCFSEALRLAPNFADARRNLESARSAGARE